ncbi:hypothetical protein ACIPWY_06590 [Streptomyces sp. NPDC090032]
MMDGLRTQWLRAPDAVPLEALVRDFQGWYGRHVTDTVGDPVTG